MKKLIAMTLVLALAPMASASFFDDFESYADQAALNAVYTQVYPAPAIEMQLDTTMGYNSNQSIHPTAPTASYADARMYVNIGEYTPTDANPIEFKFMCKLADINWHTREYIELRGYSGAGYADGELEQLMAMGSTTSGDTASYQVRTLNGDNWETTGIAKSLEWVEMKAIIKATTVEYYVDGVLGAESAHNGTGFDCLVIGSGLSSNIDVSFDDLSVQVIPEPASLALLAFGGLALIRRR